MIAQYWDEAKDIEPFSWGWPWAFWSRFLAGGASVPVGSGSCARLQPRKSADCATSAAARPRVFAPPGESGRARPVRVREIVG